MPDKQDWRAEITPHWSDEELNEVLNPPRNGIDSDEMIQRDKFRDAVRARTDEDTNRLRSVAHAVVKWKNGDVALALWAGHIQRAEELRDNSQSYQSVESVEVGLIERIAQPAYEEKDFNRQELVDHILPVIRSSPLTELRPDVWGDDQRSRNRVESVIDEYVDEIVW